LPLLPFAARVEVGLEEMDEWRKAPIAVESSSSPGCDGLCAKTTWRAAR
jgi:hypothetical protein